MTITHRFSHELKEEILTKESSTITFKIGKKEENKIRITEKNGKLIINTDSYDKMLINPTSSNAFEIVFSDKL